MGVINSNPDNLPRHYSYDHTKTLISQLNAFCKQNSKQLRFLLHFKGSELQYNHFDWKKSVIPGTVVIKRSQKSISYHVLMNLKGIYKSHETMKHFSKKLSQSILGTPQDSTPTAIEECCICMDKTPTMMLPCCHTFCSNCIQIHIIDKEQKKCPVCRVEFHEDSFSLKSKIITVIGDQETLISDLRQILLGHLRELSFNQVRQIQKQLAEKQVKNGLQQEILEDAYGQ